MSDHTTEWHGWGWLNERDALHIGRLPGRKHPVLYVIDGNVIKTLAHFKGEDEARQAVDVIDRLAGLDE